MREVKARGREGKPVALAGIRPAVLVGLLLACAAFDAGVIWLIVRA